MKYYNEIKDILTKWKNREEKQTGTSKDSFFILANYIKTNNYNLSFNDYKLIRQTQPLNNETGNIINDETKTILTAKKENLHEFFESSAPLPEEKRKRRLAPVLIVLLILILGGAAYYWFYLKDNNNQLFYNNQNWRLELKH